MNYSGASVIFTFKGVIVSDFIHFLGQSGVLFKAEFEKHYKLYKSTLQVYNAYALGYKLIDNII